MTEKFARSAYRNFLLWGVLASLAVTLCTLVDALLVGNLIGSDGLATSNLSTPVFLSYSLIGLTLGVGANVKIGRFLGESKADEANDVFHKVLTVGLIISAACLIIPIFLRDPFFRFLGVTDELHSLAVQYLTVVLYSAPLFIFNHILSVSVRTDSNPRCAAIAAGVVIVTDIVLDVVFMYVFRWGIIGASLSLCIGEFLADLVLLSHFFRKQSLLKLGFAMPKFSEVWAFVGNGFGMGSAYIFQAVVMIFFNSLLLKTSNGVGFVAIFGVIYTTSTIPFALYDGSANALSTVTSIFIGEKNPESIRTVREQGLLTVLISGLAFGTVIAVFARKIAVLFGLSAELVPFAANALRIFAISTTFTGINSLITAYWQVIGRARLAAAMSVVRNFGLMLIIGAVTISELEINGLATTYVLTELLCGAFILLIRSVSSSEKFVQKNFTFQGKSFEAHYTIRTESMAQIAGELEAACDEMGLGPKQVFFVNFVVEELLLNIIKFGLEGDRPCYINVKMMAEDGEMVLRIRDNVRSYNPFESNGDDIDNGVLAFINKRSKSCFYQRKLIFNYLYMTV